MTIHRLPLHRVRADERVMIAHHPDGSRTVCDSRGVPDRAVPATLTWEQWRPKRDEERRRGWKRGSRAGWRHGLVTGFLVGAVAALALVALMLVAHP